jgi:hypothetical protein
MDIEGSEHAALTGCRALLDRFRPALIVEVSRDALAASGSTPEQVVGLLTAAGYRTCRIGSGAGLIPTVTGEAPEGNVVALPAERAVA